MNVNDIYPSKYVKAHDLGDKNVTVTVKAAKMEDLGYGKEAERKLVIYFEKAAKGLILNRTNAMIIASMYGPETDNWLGKAVTLYAARVKAFGAWHDAVRVREQIPARNVGAARMPDAMTEAPPLDDEDDLLDVDEGEPPPRVDPDTGEIMAPQPTQNAATAPPEPDGDGNPFNDTTPYYVAEWHKLTGKEYDLVKWVATLHDKSDGGCTSKQYQYLTGIVDALTGKQHGYILSLLCQSEISSDNLPGTKVAANLLELLPEMVTQRDASGKAVKDENGKHVMVANPAYRRDICEMLTSMAKATEPA